jgi:hypothetical protein
VPQPPDGGLLQADNPSGGRRLIDEAHLLLSTAFLPPNLVNLTVSGALTAASVAAPGAGNDSAAAPGAGNASAAAPPPNPASIRLDLDGWSKTVPPSFLGISHEWNDVDELVEPEVWQLLKDLQAYGTGGPFSGLAPRHGSGARGNQGLSERRMTSGLS